MDYTFILHVSIILFFTKGFSLISQRMHLPGVVGALLSGIVLGPIGLGWIQQTEAIELFAEVGVILLMFNAGLETDIEKLMSGLKRTMAIVSGDIMVPLLTGVLIGKFLGMDLNAGIFMGVILTSTSMSITVETLNEFKQLKSPSGNAILSTAIMDDLLGVILLTIVISLNGGNGSENAGILSVVFNFVLFFIFAYVSGRIANRAIHHMAVRFGKTHRVSTFSLAYCFLLAYIAEYFGIADITGAYLAGLFLCNVKSSHYVESKTSVLSYLLFSPIFFASIGLKAELPPLSFGFIALTLLFIFGAIFSKVIGAGIGALSVKYSKLDSLRIGVGMIPRGEVTLIVAERGLALGLIPNSIFSVTVVVVIITSLVSPILLTNLYSDKVKEKIVTN